MVVKSCVSNMRLFISLWSIVLFSVVGIVACWLGNTVECALVTLSSSGDDSSRLCRQWFLFCEGNVDIKES